MWYFEQVDRVADRSVELVELEGGICDGVDFRVLSCVVRGSL